MNYYNFAVDEIEKRNIEVKEIIELNEEYDEPGYSPKDKTLYLGTSKEDEWVIDQILTFLYRHDIAITEEFKENLILYCMLHEIRHAEQHEIVNNKREGHEIAKIMLNESFCNKDDELIYLYHQKLYEEFDANMNALLRLSEIKGDLNDFNVYLANKIIYSYLDLDDKKFSNPVKNNIEIYNIKKEIKTEDNLTPECKLILGLEMEDELKSKFLKVNNDEIKVKKLIK